MTWIKTWEAVVEKSWLDELDHVNFLTYQRVADIASVEIWRRAQGDIEPGAHLQFVMTETHVRYLHELRLGASVEIFTALIAWDTKRFQLLHRLESAGNLACTVETLNLCFDPVIRRAAPFATGVSDYFASLGGPPEDALPILSISRRPTHGADPSFPSART
ncbi:thioesterase family protein [Rhizobium mongolense]|uniref:thioesterase family protein n=1 Tax=Rhizobium mongolense TaxID=57676 RepID=UPI0034A1B16E